MRHIDDKEVLDAPVPSINAWLTRVCINVRRTWDWLSRGNCPEIALGCGWLVEIVERQKKAGGRVRYFD